MLKPNSRDVRMALAAAAAALVLAACGDQPVRDADGAVPAPAAIVEVDYRCADGRHIKGRYDNTDPGHPAVRLRVDSRRFELHSVVAASGARYATESGLRPGYGLQWWTKGDEATLAEMRMDHTAADAVPLTTCTVVRE